MQKEKAIFVARKLKSNILNATLESELKKY